MENTQTVTKWAVDPMHSEVEFKVRHLVISTVTGKFKSFDGTIETTDDSFDGAEVQFAVDIDSIDTNAPDRDAHLKSDDFFAADKHPQMIFKGKFAKTGEHTFDINGQITIRETTQDITFKAELGGIMVDPYGNTKSGFEITGKVNRKEFGLNWSAVTEAGGVVVGDEVKIHLNLQFGKQA